MGKKKIDPKIQKDIDRIMGTGNFTLEEAVSIAQTWNYKPPEDPDALLQHARDAVSYERGMQMLNWQLRHNEITQADYNKKEGELYRKYHPKE